jgi:glutamate synthase (NADPH/NADH) large chain
MSGGVAYVWDPEGDFKRRCNTSMVSLESVMGAKEQAAGVPQSVWHAVRRGGQGEADETILKRLVEAHFRHTGSFRAKEVMSDWANARAKFTKVFPTEYRRALGEMAAARAAAKQTA